MSKSIFVIQTWSIIFMGMAATDLTGIKLEQDLRGWVVLFLPFSFMVGFILIVVLGIFNWRDLTRWFPQKIRQEQ